MTICGHRWYGPRADVPGASATHVCDKNPTHNFTEDAYSGPGVVVHRCVCGATQIADRVRGR